MPAQESLTQSMAGTARGFASLASLNEWTAAVAEQLYPRQLRDVACSNYRDFLLFWFQTGRRAAERAVERARASADADAPDELASMVRSIESLSSD